MKRRDFGLLAGTSFATATALRPAQAQWAAPDSNLLKTTLTPMGGERAGNADGSIPAWTGGLVSPPLPSDQPVDVQLFEDEQPLYTVDVRNMTKYENLLSEATKYQIENFGLILKVYKTHRTAAAPQYVYDNTAKNVLTAKLDPRGGRLGFTGAYGGVPFPIVDTSAPLVGGAQLVWNHLTAWNGFSNYVRFTPGVVVIKGRFQLVSGDFARTIYPYYDPNGSLETFGGYYSKGHYYYKAPSSVVGQETLVWHSTNVNVYPDIVWTLLNGQGRVRKAPNQAFDAPNPSSDGIASIDESSCFYGNPSQYDWKFIEKKELLVPYNCNAMGATAVIHDVCGPHFPKPEYVRWEKHRVWVVEATLHPGEHNVNARRRYYADEDTRYFLLGEGYDGQGTMAKAYVLFNKCVPSAPGTMELGQMTLSLLTGDYTYVGGTGYPPFSGAQYDAPLLDSYFEPQQMAAQASF